MAPGAGTMGDLFPNGIEHYLIGGLLVGAGIGLVFLLTGRIAGISSILSAAQSWWSRRPFFCTPMMLDERSWKGVLVLGLVAGAVLHTVFLGEQFLTEVQWWRLLVGGVLVGWGTRTARGCTSGHGICGVSAFAPPSLAATAIFMAAGFATAWLVAQTGLTP
ncbi:MAG: YeeE/YedE family protein [Planctomycetota bacterium]|jgi:uncharacterized membrane protein YedE/YeeE